MARRNRQQPIDNGMAKSATADFDRRRFRPDARGSVPRRVGAAQCAPCRNGEVLAALAQLGCSRFTRQKRASGSDRIVAAMFRF
jgi:hypothetical protein